jgi:hypothetical protein
MSPPGDEHNRYAGHNASNKASGKHWVRHNCRAENEHHGTHDGADRVFDQCA